MTNLQVREVPVHVYGKLKELAAREHRSLAQQTLITIERGLGMAGGARERRRAVLERIRTRDRGVETGRLRDPVEMLREDRAR
ncbi:MAG: hypothetical protein JXR37_26375 [Kiritimatiellae bacterium]|nr:hypothetical protein [Kiritimatiellia bacterium]